MSDTIRAADGGYLLNAEQFNYTNDVQGRQALNTNSALAWVAKA